MPLRPTSTRPPTTPESWLRSSLSSSSSCTSAGLALVLVGCTGTSTSPDGSDAETGIPGDPVALSEEETLFGHSTERTGTDLAFLDERLLLGAPSMPPSRGDTYNDVAWLLARQAGATRDVEATALNDNIEDSLSYEGTAYNQFGSRVVSPGDVTGDAVPDLAVAEADAGETNLWRYGRWIVFAGPDFAASMLLGGWPSVGPAAPCGDLDGNGVAELCVGNGIVFGPIVDGDGPDLTWSAESPRITGADLDGDGLPEVVVSDAATHAVYRLTTFSSGAVDLAAVSAREWTAATGSATALAAGDLDGDGAQDLVVGWSDASGDRVLVGLPAGPDLEPARTTLRVAAEELAVGDFDGDGQLDLAVGGGAEVTIWLGPLPAGELTRDDPAAHYRGLQFPTDAFGSALAARDTDGDGRAELAIGAPLEEDPDYPYDGSAGRVWWLLGAGL
jgi:hypothetical protein